MIQRFVNRLFGREDFALEDYQRETLAVIRQWPEFRWKDTQALVRAYGLWSSENWCAGWMDHRGVNLNELRHELKMYSYPWLP